MSITRNISKWPCNKSIFPYQTRSTRHAPKTLSTFKAHTRPLRPIAPLPRPSGSFNVTRENIYTIRFDQPKSRFFKLNLIFSKIQRCSSGMSKNFMVLILVPLFWAVLLWCKTSVNAIETKETLVNNSDFFYLWTYSPLQWKNIDKITSRQENLSYNIGDIGITYPLPLLKP